MDRPVGTDHTRAARTEGSRHHDKATSLTKAACVREVLMTSGTVGQERLLFRNTGGRYVRIMP